MANLTIDDKFNKACQCISIWHPVYISFYSMISRKALPDKEEYNDVTMRLNLMTDSYAVLEYNNSFIEKISAESLATLICIELNRLLLQHCTKRAGSPVDLHYIASNISANDPSLKIYLNLNNDSQSIIPKLPSVDILKAIKPDYDSKEDNFLERNFKILLSAMKDESFSGEGLDSNGSDSKGSDSKGSEAKSSQNGESNSGNDSEEESDLEKEKQAISDHFSPKQAKRNTQGWGENDMIKEQIKKIVNETPASSWGNISSDFVFKIMSANVHVIDPKAVLRKAIATAFSENMNFTRLRPNRKYQGKYLGWLPGQRHEQKHNILIATDVSGSMSDDDVALAFSCVNDFLRNGTSVSYCTWDVTCGPIKPTRYPSKQYNLSGKGGTDPRCVLEKIKLENLKYDLIVFITDCQFIFERPLNAKKIFFIRTETGDKAPDWALGNITMNDIKNMKNK